jgi:DNA-binding transcriptional ArsR family regulator
MAAVKTNGVRHAAAKADTALYAEMALYAELFRALSDPIRTEIVRMAALMDELPCTLLEKELPVSKSTISYHIKVLFHAGVLEIRKEGRFYFYRLREELLATHLSEFLDRLRETTLHEPGTRVAAT